MKWMQKKMDWSQIKPLHITKCPTNIESVIFLLDFADLMLMLCSFVLLFYYCNFWFWSMTSHLMEVCCE